jgi:hypothetical protein
MNVGKGLGVHLSRLKIPQNKILKSLNQNPSLS